MILNKNYTTFFFSSNITGKVKEISKEHDLKIRYTGEYVRQQYSADSTAFAEYAIVFDISVTVHYQLAPVCFRQCQRDVSATLKAHAGLSSRNYCRTLSTSAMHLKYGGRSHSRGEP